MQILARPNRVNEYGYHHTSRPAKENGGKPLMGQLQDLVDPETRNGHKAERQYKYQNSVIVPPFHIRKKSCERRYCGCNCMNKNVLHNLMQVIMCIDYIK